MDFIKLNDRRYKSIAAKIDKHHDKLSYEDSTIYQSVNGFQTSKMMKSKKFLTFIAESCNQRSHRAPNKMRSKIVRKHDAYAFVFDSKSSNLKVNYERRTVSSGAELPGHFAGLKTKIPMFLDETLMDTNVKIEISETGTKFTLKVDIKNKTPNCRPDSRNEATGTTVIIDAGRLIFVGKSELDSNSRLFTVVGKKYDLADQSSLEEVEKSKEALKLRRTRGFRAPARDCYHFFGRRKSDTKANDMDKKRRIRDKFREQVFFENPR